MFRLAMPSSVGWRISSPDTQSEERLVWKEGAPHQDERAVKREAVDIALKEDAPHEEEAQVHDGAPGKLEKVAEHDPVGDEIVEVDGNIKFEALFIEVEKAETIGLFPLLGLLGFIIATSPSVL